MYNYNMKYKILIITAAVIFALGIVGSVLVLTAQKKDTVVIKQNDKIIYTIDLKTASNKTFDIEYKGSRNTVEIKDGKIRVKEADCPDKVCVKTGWLSSSAVPIVCLPNHLVIEFAQADSVDAAAG